MTLTGSKLNILMAVIITGVIIIMEIIPRRELDEALKDYRWAADSPRQKSSGEGAGGS